MDDCKFCGEPLAYDNTTGICFACRNYYAWADSMTTEWLRLSVNCPNSDMQVQHTAIMRDILKRRNGAQQLALDSVFTQ